MNRSKAGHAGARPHNTAHRPGRLSPARAAALKTVRQCHERDAFVHDIVSTTVDSTSMAASDRAFAAKLAIGVVSTIGVLDDVLDRCISNPQNVTDDVRDALRISTYEMLFLDKSPHAAVDQGVELVRSIVPRASGLANAVLRQVAALKGDFPFGDPSDDMAACARTYGFPLWLAEKLEHDLGAADARAFMETSNETAPVFVAVNAIKSDDDTVVTLLSGADGSPEPVAIDGYAVEGCYRVQSAHVLYDEAVRQAIAAGKLLVADAAAQRIAQLVVSGSGDSNEVPVSSLLEIGSGRATKTILLQASMYRRMNDQVKEYVALDNHDFKIRLLEDRCWEYGVNISEGVVGDAADLADLIDPSRTFDIVFIDAPCSGLGTLRRHPEIRWRLRPDTIGECARFDLRLLEAAAPFVAPGGILAYSTCTITPEENGSVIASFLEGRRKGEFELVPVGDGHAFKTSPAKQGCDAHFLVKMRRERSC